MLFLCTLLSFQQIQLSQRMVIDQYEVALADLIQDHQSRNSASPIALSGSNPIFSTYQKIIAPYVAYISGYGSIVQQEFAKQIPYHADLRGMSDKFFKYEKEVKRVAQVFPKELQKQALDYFYQQVSGSMVQVCYRIVQQISNEYSYDTKDLDSVFVAYKLAWAAQTQNMNIVGVAQGSDFATSITQLMTSLYVAAIANQNNNVATGIENDAKKQQSFQEIMKYRNILYQVYTNNGQNDQAQKQLLAIQGLKQQQKQAAIAPQLFQKAQVVAQVARIPVVIDVTQPAQTKTKLIASINQLEKAAADYGNAATAYESAQNGVGYNKCLQAQNTINDIDMQLRSIQLMWEIFLVGSETVPQPLTLSTIQSFLQPSSSGAPVATQDAVQALQNLADVCQSVPNALNQTLALLPMLQAVMTAVSSNSACDVTIAFLSDVQEAIETLVQMLTSMIQATSSQAQTDIASAMTNASHLDSLFEKNGEIAMYVAFLPDILGQGNNSWTQFAAQFLMRSGVVSTVAAAVAQVGKYEQPSTSALSLQDITTLQSQGQSNFKQAVAAEKTSDFATAAQQYENMKNVYLKLLSTPLPSAEHQTIKSKYFLANSLWTASSLASTISVAGTQSLETLTDVPTSYVVSAYQTPAIDIALLGLTSLPTSLQSIALNQLVSTLKIAQKKDLLQIFKAYVVSQVVADQSVQFSDCFVDYQLQIKTGISDVYQSIATQALQQVTQYLKDFKTTSQMAVLVASSTSLTLVLYKAPIAAVTPLYSSAPIAADYFLGAQMLFQPGSQLVVLSGNPYVPGNDTLAASMMVEDVAYCYASAALQEITQAQSIMNDILKKIAAAQASVKTVTAKTVTAKAPIKLPKDFAMNYSQVKKGILRAQSLLVASDQSAQAYFTQAGNSAQAQAVQAVYMGLYKTLITFMKQCLVGDPFSSEYNNILSDMNNTYLQWGVELDPTKDAAKIDQINQDIVDLFVTAGTQCENVYYYQSLYPEFKQIHYMAAAQDFIAAQQKYSSMGHKNKASKMQDKVNNAYFSGCDQNIELYFYAKHNGISYTSQSGQLTNVSFDQLLADYNNFEQNGALIDPAKQSAYNSVQNLLLNAAMVYQNLAQSYQNLVTPSAASSSSNQKLLKYLQAQKLVPSDVLTIGAIPFSNAGLKEKILTQASAIYQNFLTDPGTMAAWLNLLIIIVQHIYGEDYLGATATESSTDLENQTQAFFDAEQKEASSLQNPSSAYVG